MNTINKIVSAGAEMAGVSYAEFTGNSRKQHLADARKVVAYLLRKHGFSYEQIGRGLNRHYSSVMHLEKAFHDLRQTDEAFEKRTNQIISNLKIKILRLVTFRPEPRLWPEEHTDIMNFDTKAERSEVEALIEKCTLFNKGEFMLVNDTILVTSNQVLIDELKDEAYGREISFRHTHIPQLYV